MKANNDTNSTLITIYNKYQPADWSNDKHESTI